MKGKSNYNSIDYSYVFSAKKKLELEHSKKSATNFGRMKNKWTAAAAIALASGSVVLFVPTGNAQAAEADASVKTEKVETNKQADQNVAAEGDANKADGAVADQEQQKQAQQPLQDEDDDDQTDQDTPDQPVGQDDLDEDYYKSQDQPVNTPDHIKGNVQDAWDQGYKGEGIAVAVIDFGVDPSHKDFQTAPTNPKFSKEDMEKIIKKLGHGRYVSPKFPYVHDVDTGDDDGIKENTEKANTEGSHGQHVAGIIGHADNQNDKYVVGIAPEAQLIFFKDIGINGDNQIAAGIYDVVKVGADVISISLDNNLYVQDLGDADQKAIQYATDHGVVVSIAASNDGNSASVDGVWGKKRIYSPGSDAGNYQPFNSGTIPTPALSKNAITVAAENSAIGEHNEIGWFTSWGPLPDFTLKPDVLAPGVGVISTANNNRYAMMNGTSMAAPFTSGVAALVVQRLKETNPNLKGAALVQAVKGLITSTATPWGQGDNIISPRQQGAGEINSGAATKSQVYITTEDGTSVLSLHNIQNTTKLNLIFHNLSDQAQTYTFDDMGGAYTEQHDSEAGKFSDTPLTDAQISGDNVITIAPNTTKITYTLNLNNIKKNQIVEGYLHFSDSNQQADLVVPYLGYYGDMTNEDVLDRDANDKEDPDIAGNYFTNEDGYVRGVADEYSMDQLSDENQQQVTKLYESGRVAFSPNDDSTSDIVMPFAFLKQNIKDLKVEILNDKGEVIRIVADAHDVAKSFHSDEDNETSSSTKDEKYEWDGKIYNKKTGEMEVAPDGQYTYRFVATLYNKGEHQVQTHDTPIIIDTTKPVIDKIAYNKQTNTISGTYHDTGAGFTDYSYGTVTINDKTFGFKLNDGNQNNFDNSDKIRAIL